jgi:hypothetical protein
MVPESFREWRVVSGELAVISHLSSVGQSLSGATLSAVEGERSRRASFQSPAILSRHPSGTLSPSTALGASSGAERCEAPKSKGRLLVFSHQSSAFWYPLGLMTDN